MTRAIGKTEPTHFKETQEADGKNIKRRDGALTFPGWAPKCAGWMGRLSDAEDGQIGDGLILLTFPPTRHHHTCVLSRFSRVWLCDPVDHSPPGSSVHRILQATVLEGVAVPSSRASSQRRERTRVVYISCTGRQVLHTSATWEARTIHHSPIIL